MSLSTVGVIPAVTVTGTTALEVAVMEVNVIDPSFSGGVVSLM